MCVRRCALLLVCFLSTAVALPAAEVVIRDIRGAVLIRPTSFSFDLSGDNVDVTGDDAFESGTGFEIGGRYSFAKAGSSLGLVVGLDLASDSYTYSEGDGLGATGIRGNVGGAWAFSDRWTLIAEAGFGYQIVEFSLPASANAPAFDVEGDGTLIDGRLSLWYRPFERWAFHAHLGYMTASTSLDGGGLEMEMDQDGLFAGIGMTWLFSTKPALLE